MQKKKSTTLTTNSAPLLNGQRSTLLAQKVIPLSNKNQFIKFRVTGQELENITKISGEQGANNYTRELILKKTFENRNEYAIRRDKYNARLNQLNLIIHEAEAERRIVEQLLLSDAEKERKDVKQ